MEKVLAELFSQRERTVPGGEEYKRLSEKIRMLEDEIAERRSPRPGSARRA